MTKQACEAGGCRHPRPAWVPPLGRVVPVTFAVAVAVGRDDPELRFTLSGQPAASSRIVSTPRFYDKAAGGTGAMATCPPLRNATAKVTTASRASASGGNGGQRQAEADSWASDGPGGYSDEPPF